MKIVHTVAEMQALALAHRSHGGRIAFVPTMGALHEGHLSLVRHAQRRLDELTSAEGEAAPLVVVSIFVNPLQFGPSEDFERYPRTLEADCAKLAPEGVDVVFAPSPAEMYPAGASTVVLVEGLSERLDGASRPGHFRGVTTVVAKLFQIVQPTLAVFGQKDAAQVAVLRAMVRDLNLPLEMVVSPIVREPDGLALSSRNAYLSASERSQALVLHRTLREVEAAHRRGEYRVQALRSLALSVLGAEPGARLDYLEIVSPDTLLPIEDLSGGALVAVASYFGPTRLIDNLLLPPL